MTMLNRFQNNFTHKRELSNIILFSLGKFVSLFGTFIYAFAIGLYVLKITGSGLSFATTLVFSTLPMVIVNPIAGVLADRLNKKVLVVLMDLLNGILLIGLYFLSSIYGLSLTMIYISTFIMTSLITIFDISFAAAKPNMVSENNLMSINSISKIIDSISTILGPMVGGIIFAFVDIKLFIVFNGLSFILSGISEIFIDFKFNYEEHIDEKKQINLIADVKQGFKYMLGKQEIVSRFIVMIILNFSIGFSISVPLPFIINNVLGLGSKYFGIIQGAFPIGLIIGAVFVGKIIEQIPYQKLLLKMNLVLAICIGMIALPVLPVNIITSETGILIYYCLVISIVGVAISFIDIPLISILQKSISDEYRGRVMGLMISIGKIISPLAFILSGVLINILPVYLLQLIGSGVLFTSSILFNKEYRNNFYGVKEGFPNLLKGSSIYFLIELFILVIFRPMNLEMFFLVWILATLILLIDDVFNIEANKPLDNLYREEIMTINHGLSIYKREGNFLSRERVYDGSLGIINSGYGLGLIVNIMLYVLL